MITKTSAAELAARIASEANARLSAAAPELLAALEFAAMTLAIQFSDLLPIPDEAPTDTMSEPLTVRAYRSARAAIDRAKGTD